MPTDPANPTRRDLLAAFRSRATGVPDATQSVEMGAQSVDRSAPMAGTTLRLSARLMGCDFTIVLNPGPEQVESAGESLERIAAIERWMSHYRADSQLSILNQTGWPGPVSLSEEMFRFLQFCEIQNQISNGAFDVASGALSGLWKRCRAVGRLPEITEIEAARELAGQHLVRLDAAGRQMQFLAAGVQLDPGAVGKGWGLDDAAEWLKTRTVPINDFLLSGGHSSIVAAGQHNRAGGWPVGLGNPLFTEKRVATILLKDQAMGTSGSNIQFFRHAGRRYGHLLDPRSGWPAEGMLSATVLADSAAVADALSTAFFVLGVEKAVECCRQIPDIAAILVPYPDRGTRLRPVVVGNLSDRLWWDADQAEVHYI